MTKHTCSECGAESDAGAMVQIGGHWVCQRCKPTYVQKLKEGVVPVHSPAPPKGKIVGVYGSTMLLLVAVVLHPGHDLGYHLFRALGVRFPGDVSQGLGTVMLLVAGVASLGYGIYFFSTQRQASQFVVELIIEIILFMMVPVY